MASIMERVRSLPGTRKPGELIRVRSKTIKPLSEGHIYDVLNMSLVVPWRRVAQTSLLPKLSMGNCLDTLQGKGGSVGLILIPNSVTPPIERITVFRQD